MPRGDRTGPEGMGPMTGRGYGYCGGYDAPGYTAPAPGRGAGRGRGNAWGYGRGFGPGWGRGMAWRRGWGYGPGPAAAAWGPSREQEIDALRRQAEYFEQGLEAVKSRIEELEGGDAEE